MLTKSNELELKIYGLLTVRDSTTTELSERLEITPRSLKEHVRKLNVFAEDFLHIKDLVVVDFKGNYAVNEELGSDKDRVFGYLKMATYETNTKFQIILALILKTTIKKNTLAKRLYLSATRVTTLINQLNDELAQWEISIQLDKGILQFAGRELCIRLYSYVVLADAFQSLKHADEVIDYESPFCYKATHYTKPKIIPERYSQSTLVHLQKVLDLRLAAGHTLAEVSNEKDERLSHFFDIVMDNYDESRHINKFLVGLDAEAVQRERRYFNFFDRVLLSDGVPLDIQKELVTKLLLADDFYGKLAMRCVLYLQKVGFLEEGTDESFNRLIYFLAMYFVYFDILRDSSFILDENRFTIPGYSEQDGSQARAQLLEHMKGFIEEQQISFDYDEMMVDSVLSLVLSSVQTRESVSLRIFIQTNFEMAKRSLITEFLTMHFRADALEFIDEYSSADLIVTDNIGEFPEDIPVLFFKSTTSREQWTILTDEVQDLLIKKTLYR